MITLNDGFFYELKERLESGPIIIGENHDETVARQVVKALMKQRCVRYLSVETPIAPANWVGEHGQLINPVTFQEKIQHDAFPNEFTMVKLASIAAKNNVLVYCHDMPRHTSVLNTMANKQNKNEYRDYAKQFLEGTNLKALPAMENKMLQLVAVRNQYSATYLKRQLGGGVRILHRLVILAGWQHMSAEECHANKTLQAYLGIGEDRVFKITKDNVVIEEDGD